jgi:glycolate oxidase FAD binding subunit
MTAPTAAIEALRSLIPPDRVRPVEAYAIDGITPAIAIRPANREEAARVIAAADEASLALTPLGARTALGLGRPLAAYDVALDMTALDRLVAYEPNDLTATVEAGMTLAAFQQLLAVNGQYLPADAPPSDEVTIGGLLATARPGAWRHHMPGQRDLVLGVTVVLPDGTLTHSGGRVVKNVSGYDLHRMHTGALGAFGVIVEATFKLAPLPPATRTFAIECQHVAQAAEVAFRLWDQALPLRGLSILTPRAAEVAAIGTGAGQPATAQVLLECYGHEAVLARCQEAVHREAVLARAPHAGVVPAQAWTALRTLAGSTDQVVLRLGVPSSQVANATQLAADHGATAWGHLASGAVIATTPWLASESIRALRVFAHDCGGFLQIEAAPAALRHEVDPFEGADRTLVTSLKHEFDPRGTFNRGRWQEDV